MNTTTTPYLTLRLADDRFAFAIDQVVEVSAMVAVMPFAQDDSRILGLINRHGQILPMIDLRALLKGDTTTITPDTFFIVLRTATDAPPIQQEQGAIHTSMPYIGVVVDEIFQVEYFATSDLQTTPGKNTFVKFVAVRQNQFIQILRAEAIITLLQDEIGMTLSAQPDEAIMPKIKAKQ